MQLKALLFTRKNAGNKTLTLNSFQNRLVIFKKKRHLGCDCDIINDKKKYNKTKQIHYIRIKQKKETGEERIIFNFV